MLEILIQLNAFRIDYFTDPRIPQPNGVGLYVCGTLPPNQPYSREAKQALVIGLCLILRHWQVEQLVVVYVDILSSSDMLPPAYTQMKQDLTRGFIQRVLIPNPYALQRTPVLLADWNAFRQQYTDVQWLIPDRNWKQNATLLV